MSIGSVAIGEVAISAQDGLARTTTKKPPRNRQLVAKADVVAQPEARSAILGRNERGQFLDKLKPRKK